MAAQGTLTNISGGVQMFHAYASVNFDSINAAVSGTKAITVTGVAVGDIVFVTPTTAATTGLVFEANPVIAASADTVTVRATNVTAAPIDEAAQIFHFLVLRPNVPL